MRVVVTGSNGFIGRRIVDGLTSNGVDVLGLIAAGVAGRKPLSCRTHACTLREPKSMLPVDWVGEQFSLIHLAWDMRRPRAFVPHAEHVDLLAGILDYWTPRGLDAVIAAGSAEEFGQLEGRIDSDATPEGRVSPYGWGKRGAMTLLETWSQVAEKPALWLRPFVVYGPGQQGSMLLPYAIERATTGQDAYFSDGLQERDFVHVDDVAAAFVAAVQVREPGFKAINLGTGAPVRVREVLELVARELGALHRFHLGAVERRAEEPFVQYADVRQAQSRLGWIARIPWSAGVQQVCESEREFKRNSA